AAHLKCAAKRISQLASGNECGHSATGGAGGPLTSIDGNWASASLSAEGSTDSQQAPASASGHSPPFSQAEPPSSQQLGPSVETAANVSELSQLREQPLFETMARLSGQQGEPFTLCKLARSSVAQPPDER